ncbi:MAG: hypothetical protein JSV03_01815 [Planctomycetota bacterium]|nr:MAG: hypothetical protein JSV03_01815 [Planctomycetota bacterium]
MCNNIRVLIKHLLMLAAGCWLLQAGCIRDIQREFEVLFRPEANPTLIHDSYLVDTFGPEILGLFNW